MNKEAIEKLEEVEKHLKRFFGGSSSNAYEFLSQALTLLRQQPADYDTRTIKNTEVCPCGNIFVEADDYDTLGSESGVCCPNCGNEKFQTVKDLLESAEAKKEGETK